MNRKTLLFGVVLAASMAMVTPAQAHGDYDYPLGVVSGMLLGSYLEGHHHHRDQRPHFYRHHEYRHREYRRHDSHGYRHRDRHRHHRDGGRWNRGHDRH